MKNLSYHHISREDYSNTTLKYSHLFIPQGNPSPRKKKTHEFEDLNSVMKGAYYLMEKIKRVSFVVNIGFSKSLCMIPKDFRGLLMD
jgi:hypothetical protein